MEPESKKKVPSEAKASTDETSSADSEYLLEKILYFLETFFQHLKEGEE